MVLNYLLRAPGQMENTSSPPANSSLCSSSSSSSSSSSLCPSAVTLLFLPSVYALLFLTALPGNAVSLWVFLRRISSVSPIHVFLSHLSVSNLLLSLTAPFLAAYYARGWAWPLGGGLCQLVLHGITPVLHSNIYISVLILAWVALSRFAALIQHTHAARQSSCTTLLPHAFFARLTRTAFASRVCAAVWVVALGCTLPVTVYYSVKEAASPEAASPEAAAAACYSPAVEIGGRLSQSLSAPVMALFFLFYLLVLLSYLTVLRHIRRSRRHASLGSSHSLLGRVLRNIVLIQAVLSVCLLPYHVFKPVFISLANRRPSGDACSGCHPLSGAVELKNGLLLLAALRGSTDPLMFFLLDKTFRRQTLRLLGRGRRRAGGGRTRSASGSGAQRAAPQEDGNAASATADLTQESVL